MSSLKWSNYVIKFESLNKIYLFKSITETLYALQPQEYSVIDRYLSDKSVSLNQDIKLHISELYVDGLIIDDATDEVKLFRDSFEEKMRSSISGVLYFAPSLKCNLRCSYCIIGESINSATENELSGMTEANAVQTAKWTYDMCIHHNISELKVILYGGEPMLSHKNNITFIKSLDEMIQKGEKHITLKYMIITNAYKINENYVNELIHFGVQTVQVTLDGPPDIHNKRRYGVNREKTFDTILHNLLFLSEKFENTAIRVNVDNKNSRHITELIDILHQNGLQKRCVLHFNLVDPSDYSDESGYNDETISEFKTIYEYAFQKDFNVEPWRRYCSIPSKFFFTVDPDGSVYKCSNYLAIKSKAIGDIFSGVPADSMFGKIDERCYKCKYVGVCNGGCVVMREKSKIGFSYCFAKENHGMAQAYYEALSKPEIIEKHHIRRMIR